MGEVTNIYDQLKRDEGIRFTPYKDTRGFSTVGVGHNLDANPLPNETYPMFPVRAFEILNDDVSRIRGKLVGDLPWVANLPDVYEGILLNMSFNMGAHGTELFHHMLADIQSGNYAQAAVDMKNSAWYTQVGQRAERLALQMTTGVWQ